MDLQQQVQKMLEQAMSEMVRPSVLFKPNVYPDGDQWCALYGVNIQEGVFASGPTPELACRQFDIEWMHAKPPAIARPPKTPPEPPRPPMEPS